MNMQFLQASAILLVLDKHARMCVYFPNSFRNNSIAYINNNNARC